MAKPDRTAKSQRYMTPIEKIVNPILRFESISEFCIDTCCSYKNIPAKRHFIDGIFDGLKEKWNGKICFMNPPFKYLKKWLEKAFSEKCSVWCVIPGDRLNMVYFNLLSQYSNWFIAAVTGKINFIDPDLTPEENKQNELNGGLNTPVFILYIGKNAGQYAKRWKKEQPVPSKVFVSPDLI